MIDRIELASAAKHDGRDGAIVIDAESWRRDPIRFAPFDDAVEAGVARGARVLRVVGAGPGTARAALAIRIRYQRWFRRTNRASEGAAFRAILERHRALHDLAKPLVKADYDHALDAWQWMLTLDREASLAAQIAALFHDVERLVSEADVRVEQHAADYQAFKDAHAARGAELARDAIADLVDPRVEARVADLVARHERPGDDRELLLLNDADALSFFSLNSSGFLDYYGPPHTAKKVAYTLARLRPAARAHLEHVRLREEVACILHTVAQPRCA